MNKTCQSIIIPAFNEAQRIGVTLELLVAHLELEDGVCGESEVIVVCDGCTDRTEAMVKAYARRLPLRVIAYARNRGKGYAVRLGVAASRGRVVAFMDADGSTPLRELENLSEPILRNCADVVIGSRRALGAVIGTKQSIVRNVLGRVFVWHNRVALGLPLLDTQCGFKVLNGEVARDLFRGLSCDGFAFDLELLAEARECGLRVIERGIEWHDVRGSKVHPLRDGFQMVRAAWQIRRRVRNRRRAKAGTWASRASLPIGLQNLRRLT